MDHSTLLAWPAGATQSRQAEVSAPGLENYPYAKVIKMMHRPWLFLRSAIENTFDPYKKNLSAIVSLIGSSLDLDGCDSELKRLFIDPSVVHDVLGPVARKVYQPRTDLTNIVKIVGLYMGWGDSLWDFPIEELLASPIMDHMLFGIIGQMVYPPDEAAAAAAGFVRQAKNCALLADNAAKRANAAVLRMVQGTHAAAGSAIDNTIGITAQVRFLVPRLHSQASDGFDEAQAVVNRVNKAAAKVVSRYKMACKALTESSSASSRGQFIDSFHRSLDSMQWIILTRSSASCVFRLVNTVTQAFNRAREARGVKRAREE